MMKTILLIICLASIIHSERVPENLEDVQMRIEQTVKQAEQAAEAVQQRIQQEIESHHKNQETEGVAEQEVEQEITQSKQINNEEDVVSNVEKIQISNTNENLNENSKSQESQTLEDSNKEEEQENDLCKSENCSSQNDQNHNTQEQQKQQSNEDQKIEKDLEQHQIPLNHETIKLNEEQVITNQVIEESEDHNSNQQQELEQEGEQVVINIHQEYQVLDQELILNNDEEKQEIEVDQVKEEQEINNSQQNQHQHHEHIHKENEKDDHDSQENVEHVHTHEHIHDHTNEHAQGHTHEHAYDHTNEHIHTNEHTHDHSYEHHHDHSHEHTHQHIHDHTHHHHYQYEEQTYTGQNLQNGWQVQLSFIPNFSEIQEKVINFQNQLPKLLEKYLPNSKQNQINYSVLIVSFPSLPIFLLLLITVGIRNRGTTIQYMIAFSFGTMLGDVFFHMLPQILGTHSHSHDDHHHHDNHDNPQMCLVLGGVLMFAFIDLFIIKLKNLRGKRDDSHDHEHNNSIIVFLFGDFLHNFTDGIALAATYSISIASGITTTIAIFMHEIPHEVGDFAYLLKQGKCVFVILSTQIFTSLGCLAGGYVGLHFASTFQQELLCLTCGSFLYVALVNILPELKQSFSYRPKLERLILNLISIAAGLYLMKFVGQLE